MIEEIILTSGFASALFAYIAAWLWYRSTKVKQVIPKKDANKDSKEAKQSSSSNACLKDAALKDSIKGTRTEKAETSDGIAKVDAPTSDANGVTLELKKFIDTAEVQSNLNRKAALAAAAAALLQGISLSVEQIWEIIIMASTFLKGVF